MWLIFYFLLSTLFLKLDLIPSDNCHSTPLHVGQYLLDVARSVNPNIYIIAELFAGSADRDNEFVFTLGLHSLIREAMVAWDVHELSRQIHQSGGVPAASVATSTDYLPRGTGDESDGHFYEMQGILQEQFPLNSRKE